FTDICALLDPFPQARQDLARNDGGCALAPVFPREIAVPVLPGGRLAVPRGFLAREAQVADRNNPPALCIGTITVGKGVELLHVAQWMMGLLLHPGTQACLERPM